VKRLRLDDEKGLRFWNREAAKRKKKLGLRNVSDAIESFERRFLCPDCIYYFFSQFKVND
jgi:hypothetical protein